MSGNKRTVFNIIKTYNRVKFTGNGKYTDKIRFCNMVINGGV